MAYSSGMLKLLKGSQSSIQYENAEIINYLCYWDFPNDWHLGHPQIIPFRVFARQDSRQLNKARIETRRGFKFWTPSASLLHLTGRPTACHSTAPPLLNWLQMYLESKLNVSFSGVPLFPQQLLFLLNCGLTSGQVTI